MVRSSTSWSRSISKKLGNSGPYPDKSVSHVCTRLETVQIRLTTTWSGRYRLAGSQEWLPVSGMATTTSVDDPLELREYRTRLVNRPLDD